MNCHNYIITGIMSLAFHGCASSAKQRPSTAKQPTATQGPSTFKEPIEEWRSNIRGGGSRAAHEKGGGKIAIRAGCTKVWQNEITMQLKLDKSSKDESKIASRLLRAKLIERLGNDHLIEISDAQVAELYGLVATQNGMSEAELDSLIEDKRGMPLAVYKRSVRQSALELRLGQFLLFKKNKERQDYPPEEVTEAVDLEIQRLRNQLDQARIEEHADECYELPP